MKWNKRLLITITMFAAAFLAAALPAHASTITYDNTISNPAFFNGSGNPSGGFTTATSDDGSYQVSLRAKYRQNPAVIDTPDGTYDVVSGTQTNTTSGGNGANPARAAWSIDFDMRDLLGGNLTSFGDYAQFTVTDETAGVSNTVNPMTYFCDNSTWNSTSNSKNPDGSPANNCSMDFWSTSDASENSENGVFANFPINGVDGYLFDPNAAHYYTFNLGLYNAAGAQLDDDIVHVSVDGATAPVPEPASMMLLGSGLVGMVPYVRKRFRKNT